MLADLVRRYWVLGMECSLLEIQKLAWFLERAIERYNPAKVLRPMCPPCVKGCATGAVALMLLPARIACLMTGRWALLWSDCRGGTANADVLDYCCAQRREPNHLCAGLPAAGGAMLSTTRITNIY
jgi:hypothetical protein